MSLHALSHLTLFSFFFFNDTATTEIYTLSLHDALPISTGLVPAPSGGRCASTRRSRKYAPVIGGRGSCGARHSSDTRDRESTSLKSSHGYISYAVFCFKKKKK